MLKILSRSCKVYVVMMLLTGLIYPALVTQVPRIIFRNKMDGSLIRSDDRVIGSELIGQEFVNDKYFWPRPSFGNYDALASGGSNLSPTSTRLKNLVRERAKQDDEIKDVPADLLYASGSGLDPHISPESAYYQLPRVIRVRQLNSQQQKILGKLVEKNIEGRTWGFLGERRVNVLRLNRDLDNLLKE